MIAASLPTLGNLERKHVVNTVFLLFLVVVVLPFVVYTFPQLVGATESYVVKSGSMAPTIQTGSVIFVYEVDPTTIEEGDIIAYDLTDPDRRITTHRVHDVISDGELRFRTKGDMNEEPDQYVVPADAVIGKVPIVAKSLQIPFVGHIEEYPLQVPYLGTILVFAGSKQGILLFVMIPAALLILTEVYDLVKAFRQQASTDVSEQPSKAGED